MSGKSAPSIVQIGAVCWVRWVCGGLKRWCKVRVRVRVRVQHAARGTPLVPFNSAALRALQALLVVLGVEKIRFGQHFCREEWVLRSRPNHVRPWEDHAHATRHVRPM